MTKFQGYSQSDIQYAMLRTLPRGPAWQGPTLLALLKDLAPTYVRTTAAGVQQLVDSLPTTTLNLLPEWEESLGLPDACSPAVQTVQQRQAAVAAKWAARGGQSVAYFINLAKLLGYTITITEFAPWRLGQTGFGSPLAGVQWAYAWQINAPAITVQYFELGHNSFGDAFQTYSNTSLQCRILALKPAHTTAFFVYS